MIKINIDGVEFVHVLMSKNEKKKKKKKNTERFSNYSRPSVARTRMARLPRLFQTRSWAPGKIHSCIFRII